MIDKNNSTAGASKSQKDHIADASKKVTEYTPQCFYTDDPPEKFIAVYDDGSGCEIFCRHGIESYYQPRSNMFVPDKHWFTDAGYLWFVPLPDDFEIWIAKQRTE